MSEPTPVPDAAAAWRDEVAFAERLQLEASFEYTSKSRMRQIALTALRNYLALAEMFLRANEAAVEAMKAQENSFDPAGRRVKGRPLTRCLPETVKTV